MRRLLYFLRWYGRHPSSVHLGSDPSGCPNLRPGYGMMHGYGYGPGSRYGRYCCGW